MVILGLVNCVVSNYKCVSIIMCKHDADVFIYFDVASNINCEHAICTCINYDCVSIIMYEHAKWVFINYNFVNRISYKQNN